jgi:two-component system cell cycle response regulator
VKFSRIRNLRLRTRFLVAMGAMFIPLFVIALGSGIFLRHAADALNQAVEQPVYKLQATSRLQKQIRHARDLVREYAATGRYPLRAQFESDARMVEDGFVEILNRPFLTPQEYQALTETRREWQDSVRTAGPFFTSQPSKAVSDQLDRRINRILFALDQVHESYYGEIGAQRARLDEAEKRFLLIIAVTVGLGLIGAVAGAVWLARSVLVPLREFEKGMAQFARDDLSYRFTPDKEDEIGRLAREFNSMAERLVEHRSKLEELSVRDGLTGLYNRREFDKRLQEEMQRSRRYHHPFCLLLIDVDRFKDVNDRYGHQAGDEVLIGVGDLVQLIVRPVDVVCRYGGEELVVILSETNEKGALIVAERIRRTVAESMTATPRGDTIQVTVSVGLAAFPRDGDTPAEIIKAADEALYAAKQEGRNLVRSHQRLRQSEKQKTR